MDIAMEMDVQTAATVLEKIAVNNSRPLVGWSSRTPPSSRITPSSKAAPRSRTPERKKAVDSAEKRVPEKRVLLSTAAAAAAGPRERPVNTPPDAPQEKVTLLGELENGKQQSSSALDVSRHLLPTVKAVVSQSISSSSVPGQFVKFSSLMSQLARTSPSLSTTSSSLRSSRSSQLPPSSPSASSPSDMTKPRPTPVNKSISRAPSPSRGGSQSSVASASTARPSSPSLSRPKPQASSSRPSSPSLSRPNPQAASSRPSSPSLSRPNPQAGSSRPSTPTRVMSRPSSSVTPKVRNPTPTRTSNAVTAAAPASTLISTILNSSRTGAAPRSLNLGPTGAKYSSSILPVNPVASLKRSPSSSLSSDSTLTRPSSSSSPLIPGNAASRRPASPSRPVGKSSDSSSSSHTRPVSIATRPASPSPRVAKHSSEASHSSSSAAAPAAVTVATRPPSPSRPVPKSSGTSSSVSSLTAANVAARPASPSSRGAKVSVSSSPSSSLPPPISVANRAASPSRPVAKSLSSLSSSNLTARSSAAATKAASPASAIIVSHPSIPTEHQTKARKSPVPNSTPVKPPTPTRHNRSSSLSSLNFANLKPAPSSASTLNNARASPSESPKSNIASSGECNLDTVPSNSGSKVAAAMKSMLEFQAQQEQQQQQLQMTGFKHSPGSPKTSARVVPEGLPVSPLTLNAKKRCGWITSQSDWAMVAYHDEEWGMPTYDDKLLFELMLLEGAQADLNWSSILALRDDFRVAFAGFDPAVVAMFDEKKIANLIANPRILIPEAKVRGAIDNAKRIVEIAQEYGSLSEFLWGFVNHKPVVNHYKLSKQVPVKTPKSEALSNELVQRGFRFVGPTTMYALMQAAGLVNDHLVTCFRHEECAAMNNISPPTDPHKEIQLKKERWNRTDDNLWTFPSTFNSKTLPASEPGPWLNFPVMDNNSRLSSSPYEPVWAELPMIEEAFEDEI